MIRMNKLLVPLAFLMLFSNGVAVAAEGYLSDLRSEPSDCYALAGEIGELVGYGYMLCSGTTDASTTIDCFKRAYGHPDNGGFGLSTGFAVRLCKSNSQPIYGYQ